MKRDLELVRKLLLEVERADGPVPTGTFTCDGFSQEMVDYHIWLLEGQELVDVRHGGTYYDGTRDEEILGLTWEGCDYLDAIRDEDIWRKLRNGIGGLAGALTFASIKSLASELAARAVREGLGLD